MFHVVDVDQSGKVGFTGEDTVLAFANGMQFSILIPATVLRECLRVLRARGYSGTTLYTQLFATGLFFLLRDAIGQLARVVIDVEYPGQDNMIKVYVVNLLRRDGKQVEADQIQFAHIGKKSPAHELAIDTLRRRRKPDRVVTLEEIVGQFREKKEKEKKEQ